MTLRLAGIGDSHCEEGPRFGEFERVYNGWFVDYVRHDQPDLVVHTGDIYEKASTPLERLAVADLIRGTASHCPVVVVRGNHVVPRDIAILAALEAKYPIHVVESAEVLTIGDRQGRPVHIAAVDWPTRASQLDEEGTQLALRQVLSGLGNELAARGPGPRLHIGHYHTDGAVTGKGQPIRGGAIRVSLADLALVRAQATVMGHIHKAQEWEYDGAPILYTGSQFRTSFGENEAKSIVSMTIDGNRVAWERIPTPARAMILAEGHFDGKDLLVDAQAHETVQGADIRLHYTVALEDRMAAKAAADAIEAQWLAWGAAHVLVDPETLTTTRARAPGVASAETLEEKIQAWWEVKGDVPEPVRARRLLGRVSQLTAGAAQ